MDEPEDDTLDIIEGDVCPWCHHTLRTLDLLQLRLHAQPLTIVPEQMTIWGHAWLQFGDTNVRCVVQVKRWTADAVGVQVTIDGEKLRCWIWQGACQRISNPTDAW